MPLFPLGETENPPNSCNIPLVVVEAELSISCLLITKTDEPTLLSSTKDLLGVTTILPKSSIATEILLIKKTVILKYTRKMFMTLLINKLNYFGHKRYNRALNASSDAS